MLFHLFIPYQSSAAESQVLDDYYASEEDYINALQSEESNNGALVYSTMAGGGIQGNTYYGGFNNTSRNYNNIIDSQQFAKTDCTLYSPNGMTMEDVDSIIDKFAAQSEFLVTVKMNESSMDAEFEEEMRSWNRETNNILQYGKQMGGEWIDKNVPKRNLRLSFLNKSNKEVKFQLENCEIEEKVAQNRYVLYVKRMTILK